MALTAHDRQTMMQITRAEIIAVTLLIHQPNLSDRSARFFEFCNQAVSLMLELTITSARQRGKARYCNGRLPATDIHPINHR